LPSGHYTTQGTGTYSSGTSISSSVATITPPPGDFVFVTMDMPPCNGGTFGSISGMSQELGSTGTIQATTVCSTGNDYVISGTDYYSTSWGGGATTASLTTTANNAATGNSANWAELLIYWANPITQPITATFSRILPDGSCSAGDATGTLSTTSCSLTTSNTDDIILAFVSYYNGAHADHFTSVTDGQNLTWAERGTVLNSGSLFTREYYAKSSNPLSGDSITLTLSAHDYPQIICFGVSGANYTTPFDTNAAIPAKANANGVTISTSHANDLLIAVGTDDVTSHVPTNPSGYTTIQDIPGSGGFDPLRATYDSVSATKSSASVAFSWTGSPTNQGILFDAIMQSTRTISLDNSCSTGDATGTVSTISCSLTTSNTNDIIIAIVSYYNGGGADHFTSVTDGQNLTWTERGTVLNRSLHCPFH